MLQPASDKSTHWVVYILLCADETLYTGITNDLSARLERHQAGKGAKYTRGRRPERVLYSEDCGSRSLALKRERAIKRLPRAAKLALAAASA